MSSSRDYPDRPFLGVSAVIQSNQGLLLIERGKTPLAGLWSLPGGVVESGETLEQAIIREIKEETGLSFTPSYLADLVEIIRPDSQGKTHRHYVIAVFYGNSSSMALQAGDDAAMARWVPLSALGDYPLTDGTLDVIHRILHASKPAFGHNNGS
ncbi:MAG: NUDIX hydrolase [Cohaesibacter sp.]|nr:NUDIX hydrolase [Cohaesibacter sp.]